MTPQTELCVPKSEPIPVREISPSSMATFLKESHPGLEFEPSPTYPEIFSKLRGLPFDEQEKLLKDFYSQKVEAFPNGAELGRFLARINNISWFQPKSPPDEESLKRLCQQTLSRLNLPKLPLRIIEEDWSVARHAARDPAHDAIQATITLGAHLDADGDPTRGTVSDEVLAAARDEVWIAELAAAHDAGAHDATRGTIEHAVWEATWAAARGTASNAARDAAWGATQGATQEDAADSAVRGAEWIVVKDLMPHRGYHKGNPFEPLMEIYELGCWPIGIVPDQNGKKKFVIFVPSIQKIT